jgi:signal transduction histidine kinase
VLPLSREVLPLGPVPFPPEPAAAAAALAAGRDLRTATVGGAPARLLTYRTGLDDGPALLQLGRPLGDQQRLLAQLLTGLLALGGLGTLGLGGASWWLAGRSIAPVEAAWERQRRFVANASHELRAPLTLLRASAEVALRDLPAEDRDRRGLLEDVLGECDHIARLVEDLLLLSRLDAGRLAVAPEEVALPELLVDLGRAVGRLAADRGVRLEVEPGGGTVWADRARLRQVLIILLDNALGHTPAGGTVRVRAAGGNGEAVLVVEDTGPGIAPADLGRVFEPFFRSDRARADRRDGSGLGLAIAKALVEAHGGTIRMTSPPGAGARAEVRLPRRANRRAAG